MTVCQHIDCRVQVLPSQYAEFLTTTSNAVILETKRFSGLFIAFLKYTSSLEHFGKKDGPSSLSISEILNCTGSGYLNV